MRSLGCATAGAARATPSADPLSRVVQAASSRSISTGVSSAAPSSSRRVALETGGGVRNSSRTTPQRTRAGGAARAAPARSRREAARAPLLRACCSRVGLPERGLAELGEGRVLAGPGARDAGRRDAGVAVGEYAATQRRPPSASTPSPLGDLLVDEQAARDRTADGAGDGGAERLPRRRRRATEARHADPVRDDSAAPPAPSLRRLLRRPLL